MIGKIILKFRLFNILSEFKNDFIRVKNIKYVCGSDFVTPTIQLVNL